MKGQEEIYENLCAAEAVTPAMLRQWLAGEFGPGMNGRVGRIILKYGLQEVAMTLSNDKEAKVGFRAAWSLEWVYYADKEAFRPYAEKFLDAYLHSTNPGAHRSFSKMICDMTRCGILNLDGAQAEAVAEKSFDLLIDPATKVAVRVWTGEILFDLSPRLGWVEEHLEEVVRDQLRRNPSPAAISHSAKLLRRMAVKR